MQAILLVAPGSYEERVLTLVEGKRHLFDNVVDPDATEDVVSVSKRLAEILAADFASIDALRREPAAEDEASVPESGTDATRGPAEAASGTIEVPADLGLATGNSGASALNAGSEQESTITGRVDHDALVRSCIVPAEHHFGARIERILGQRGQANCQIQRGLVLVLDRVDEEDDRAIQSVSGDIPVALIDRRALASLNRLGAASPLAGAEPVYLPTDRDRTAATCDSPARTKGCRQPGGCPAPAAAGLVRSGTGPAAGRAAGGRCAARGARLSTVTAAEGVEGWRDQAG